MSNVQNVIYLLKKWICYVPKLIFIYIHNIIVNGSDNKLNNLYGKNGETMKNIHKIVV